MKRLVILFLFVIALVGGAIAAAPFIAATDLAKRRIATQIEEWTGHPVTFVGEPRVKLFPFLSLTIDDVRLGSSAPDADGRHFVEMDKLTCRLRLLPFLIGRAEVAEFQLVRPHFAFTVDADGNRNWIGKRSSIAAGDGEDVGGTPRQIAEIKLGRFRVVDGTVVFDDRRNGWHEELTAVKLEVKWPEVAEAAAGRGGFNWRGEHVELNGSINQPLKLIAGEASPARFALASKPLRMSFTGSANGLGDLQLEGQVAVTAPSVRQAFQWFGVPMGQGSILSAGMIEGDVNWVGRSLTFPAARIELDGNLAEGSITVALSEELPRIQATLASERLDLSAYVEAFQAKINADGPWQTAPVRMSLLDFADLDIRLSAGEILVGAGRLGRSAAAIALSDGELAVNIGEAQFYSGTLAADVAVGMDDDKLQSSVRITLDNTPAGVALTDLAGLSLVDGTTSATIALTGSGETWGEVAGSLAGTADLAIADGALVGFELAELAALSGGFNVADPGAGTGRVPVDTVAGTLQLADGTITSDDLHAEGESFAIDVGGQVSLIDNRVRAKGVLNATRAGVATDERREIPFVVSGSWASPLLLPDYERLIRRGNREHGAAPPVGAAARPTPPNG